jgi:hypothetical protein
VEAVAEGDEASRLVLEPEQVLGRIERQGDLLRPLLSGAPRLPAAG